MTQIERMYMLLLECDNKFPIDVITLAEIKKDYAAKLSRWQQQEQTLTIPSYERGVARLLRYDRHP